MHGCKGGQGACMVAPGVAWLIWGAMCGCSGGHAWLIRGGVCVVDLGGHAWLIQGGVHG